MRQFLPTRREVRAIVKVCVQNHAHVKEIMDAKVAQIKVTNADTYQPEPPLAVPCAEKSDSAESDSSSKKSTDSSSDSSSDIGEGTSATANNMQ